MALTKLSRADQGKEQNYPKIL